MNAFAPSSGRRRRNAKPVPLPQPKTCLCWYAMIVLRIGFLLLLQFWAAGQFQMTVAESRKLLDAVLPTHTKNIRHLVIELEREHEGCVVYHAYQIRGTTTFPVGYWSIDTRTAEVWNDLIFERVTNRRLTPVQLAIRKRLGVTDNEQSASISNPCYGRDSGSPYQIPSGLGFLRSFRLSRTV